MTQFDARRMQLVPEALGRIGLREHMRLGWHIYSMFGGQELMRRGVSADDELGAFLLDLAGEWLAVRRFQDEPGGPVFRSAPAPAAADDVRALGSSVGAALAGSNLHGREVEDWISQHSGSRFANVAPDLLVSRTNVTSPSELFDALAAYYRRA